MNTMTTRYRAMKAATLIGLRRFLKGWLILITAFFATSCSDNEADAGASMGYTRVAFWSNVLSEHPDLPDKLDEISYQRGVPKTKRVPGTVATVTVHSYLGRVTIDASTVSAIVTDLNGSSLAKLSAYLKTIPERAREMGIISERPSGNKARVIVLGSDGRVDIKGSTGSDIQVIDMYDDTLAAETTLKIHMFEGGERAIDSILESFAQANQARGPPKSSESVIIVGKLKELNIEGASGVSEQTVSFSRFMNGVAGEHTGRHMYAAAATMGAAAYVAKKAASKASSSNSSGSSPGKSSGGRKGGGRGR